MVTLILWEVNWSIVSKEFTADPEENRKYRISNLERLKKDIDSGVIKMWGMSPAGGRGFMVFEGDEKELFALLQRAAPRFTNKVKPMLSVDEVLATLKGMQQ